MLIFYDKCKSAFPIKYFVSFNSPHKSLRKISFCARQLNRRSFLNFKCLDKLLRLTSFILYCIEIRTFFSAILIISY